jgi:hypothetical protein
MLSDSTRAFYQEKYSWTPDEMAAGIVTIWSLTLGYDVMSPSPADTV